jgi:hypothetical protein
MTWYQEELANRVAEWMTTHGVDAANEGRMAAHPHTPATDGGAGHGRP